MDNDQLADQNVEETPQVATPATDQTTDTNTEEVETPVEETDSDREEVNPRTEDRFNKLTKQLAEEREKRIRLERAYTPPTPAIPEWYDPTTGVVDPNRLQQRETAMISQLSQLQQQQEVYRKREEVAQEKEAYAAYPELKSNDRFHEEVIRKLATEFAVGNNPTMKEAADAVMEFAKGLTTKAEKEGARKALEQLAPKEQASLEATGRSDRRLPSTDLASLSRQSRFGGDSGTAAVLARLRNVPSV